MDLLGFFTGRWPENHPFAQITAVPGRGNLPAMWLLGSSGYSAQVAGLLGLPFAFAHHFSAANTLPALALYRKHFRPSDVLDRPYAMVAAAVVCAETDERARFLAGSGALSFLRLRSGRPGPLPSPEEAAAYPYNEMERAFVEDRLATQIVGAPNTVQRGIADLVDAAQADELMITTMVYDPADRLGSFERVAALARASSGAPRPADWAITGRGHDRSGVSGRIMRHRASFGDRNRNRSRGRCKSMPGSGWVIARGLHVAGPCQHSLIPPAVSPGGRSGGRDGR